MNLNPAPVFLRWKQRIRIIVTPPTRHDRHLMSLPFQRESKIRQMLCRRNDVRIKRLIKQKDFQRRSREIRDQKEFTPYRSQYPGSLRYS